MAMSIDTLIQNLSAAAESASATAYGYTNAASEEAKQTPLAVGDARVSYLTPSGNRLNVDLPAGLAKTASRAVGDLIDELDRFYAAFFPNVSAQYQAWLTRLAERLADGDIPLTDNAAQNRYEQAMDRATGMRNATAIRAEWAARGYGLPPGEMVRAIQTDTDTRSEQLLARSVSAANQAVSELTGSYTTLLNAALATSDARITAIKAMTEMIRVTGQAYKLNADLQANVLHARSAAAQAAMAYYKAELELDDINTKLYQQNIGFDIQRFEKSAGYFMRNEADQTNAALARAGQAGRIAQAAYSALNTVTGASNVGF